MAVKQYELTPDQAQCHPHHITQRTGHRGQMIAKLAQRNGGIDTVHHEVC